MTTLRIKLDKTVKRIDKMSYFAVHDALGKYSIVYGGNNHHSYNGFHRESKSGDIILAVHLEKRRGKMVTTEEKVGRAKKPQVVRKWQPSYWIMTITHIPVDLFKYLPNGTKFAQHKHHWELTTGI